MSDILFEQRPGLAVVTLNRPQALNATSLEMFRAFAAKLKAFSQDPSVKMILLRGAGPRAFCAGGDVRWVHQWRTTPQGLDDPKHQFFAEEYRLIFDMHRSLKPIVALTHGITFGGGAGLAVNSARRVASESFQLSMPEIFIGSIPDVGAIRFFDRCPGKIGLYLALTATRIGPADAIYCDLLTHFVPQAGFDLLTDAFASEPMAMDKVLARFAEPPGRAKLAALRPAIDRCFSFGSVEEIQAALRDERDPWAAEALELMGRGSPLSLKIIFEMLKRSQGISLADSLKLELRIIQHLMRNHDFYEGVRSVLIDKDRNPKWQFPTVKDVPNAVVEEYFAPIGGLELAL
jgi:enoyl-CoA hydratase